MPNAEEVAGGFWPKAVIKVVSSEIKSEITGIP